MPLSFIENRGQLDSRVAYYVQGRDTSLYFTADGMTLAQTERKRAENGSKERLEKASLGRGIPHAPDPASRWVVKLDFVGANPNPKITAGERLSSVVSYFKGPREDWKEGLPTYGSITYSDLWPGIDLVYSGAPNRLKYSFLLKPGADASRIQLAYRGADAIRVNGAGQLEVQTPAGVLQDDRPTAYQDIGGRRVAVGVQYSLDRVSAGMPLSYRFAIDSYDRSRPLVLDPAFLVYAGYIGGNTSDEGRGIAVDSSGNAYVTGYTASTQATFPVTVGPDLTFNGGYDAFVAKVNAAGNALVYCGYIGGSGSDYGHGIAVDGSGNAYVIGSTNSTQSTFPVTVGPDLTYNGGYDAFVARVNAAGTALVYCGYIGGNGEDSGVGIAVDGSGNAYVTGVTGSTQATFPVTVGPDLTYHGGGADAFVAKVNAAGTALVYCGYIGGSFGDDGIDIAVDGSGNAYVTGYTASSQITFPVTVGPDLTFNGYWDAFVARVNATGTALVYCGYIGGNGEDRGLGIAVDGSGNAYVTGITGSTQTTFPVTAGPDLTHNGDWDAFVARVNATGTALVYCGYIGGSGFDDGRGIAVNSSGNAYVTGVTGSDETTFPVTVGPDLIYNGGTYDAFVARVNATGTALVYCGYIGGSSYDQGHGIAVDGSGNAYVTGATSSTEATFPVTVGPDLTYSGGGVDAFVAKITGFVKGDFNGDGKTDILWRHTSGADYVFFMNGTTVSSGASLVSVDPSWSIVGTADFNGDGMTDILWRHASGANYVFFMNGINVVSGASLTAVETDWSVAATGDFNGDEKPDILWRHTSGDVYVFFMDGISVTSGAYLSSVDPSWSIAGTGDFNGDGKSDILWRRTTGAIYVFFMDGISVASGASLPSVDPGWSVAAVGDFSNDGKPDILWRHISGAVYVWLMNGTTVASGVALPYVDTSWSIVGPK